MLVHYWLVWLLTILSNTKTKKQKTKKQKWSNILNQILHVPWWHEFCPGVIICDWHFFLFFFLFCFWKWMRKLRIFYFAYSQSHSSRSDHGGQEFWYFLRVECILLKLQNLASLGAEFVPRSLLQRFFLSQGLCWNLYCLLRGTPVFIDWTLTIPANGVNPVLFMEEQEPERTKDTRRIKKKKKKAKKWKEHSTFSTEAK